MLPDASTGTAWVDAIAAQDVARLESLLGFGDGAPLELLDARVGFRALD